MGKPFISPSRRKKSPPIPETMPEPPQARTNPLLGYLWQLRAKLQQKQMRYALYAFLGLALVTLAFFIMQLYRSQRHNEQFFSLFEEYKKISSLPEGETKKEEHRKLAQRAFELCDVIFPTKESRGSCLLAAAASIQAKSPQKAAFYLEKVYDNYHGRYIGPFTLFYAAYAYEEAGDFQKALELYRESEAIFKKIEKEDIALYHQGRILYYLGSLDEAEKIFQKIEESFPASPYLEDAQKYRILIAKERLKKNP
ncbi:MAG: tetratricopeptide repeat protein [Leptospiraceae bacterium]|nr:tetratricopeptide repeat protein [Leptospiraceae bacterium]MDW8306414.1 tetratricopeptide repeat protein [Leptospiraceae bacterium]